MKWSFSSYDSYNTCARRYFETRIAKHFVEVPGQAALWGTRVHEALERSVRDGVPLPSEMPWALLVERLRGAPGAIYCERQLAVDKNLEACAFDADEAWCRGIADVLIVHRGKALALDYKSGKRKLTEQLRLMALLTFASFPEVKVVDSGFIWLKENARIDQERFHRCDKAKLWSGFFPRLQQIKQSEDTGIWPAKPSGLCKNWCSVTSCAYNGNYRRET